MDQEVMINLMVELAGLEEELADARATLAHHARRDLHLRQLQEEYEADAAQVQAAGTSAAVDLRMTEGRIRDVEAALARKNDQVVGLSDRRQYQALKNEIKGLKAELDRLETKAIRLLDEVGNRDQKAHRAKDERDSQADRGSAERAKLGAEAVKAQAAEKEITEEIARLTGLLPEAIARHVVRLRNQYPQAVVRVQDRTCGGCSSLLPTQQGLDAEQGRALVRCASCARFVVRKSWK